MLSGSLQRHPGIMALVCAAPGVAVVLAVGSQLSNEAGHAASHLAMAIVASFLLTSSRRWADRAAVLSRTGRTIVKLALGLITVASVFEAAGAFGFDGYARINALATVHDVAMVPGFLGVVLLLLGAIVVVISNLSRSSLPRWLVGGLTCISALLATTMLLTAVLGGG